VFSALNTDIRKEKTKQYSIQRVVLSVLNTIFFLANKFPNMKKGIWTQRKNKTVFNTHSFELFCITYYIFFSQTHFQTWRKESGCKEKNWKFSVIKYWCKLILFCKLISRNYCQSCQLLNWMSTWVTRE